jgi:CDP-diacylglycerol--glycerol-3-phosphate 3-phosphatidyltransferase
MNIPNTLTLSRIFLAPVFVPVFFWESRAGAVLALAVVCVSELTDLFDGWAARKYNQVTDLGKLLDPLADSISRLTVFVCLAVGGIAPVYFVLLILYRDGIVSVIRMLSAASGKILAARMSGKIKAIAQAAAIIGILALRALADPADQNDRTAAAWWLMAMAAGVTAWSAVDYWLGYRRGSQT